MCLAGSARCFAIAYFSVFLFASGLYHSTEAAEDEMSLEDGFMCHKIINNLTSKYEIYDFYDTISKSLNSNSLAEKLDRTYSITWMPINKIPNKIIDIFIIASNYEVLTYYYKGNIYKENKNINFTLDYSNYKNPGRINLIQKDGSELGCIGLAPYISRQVITLIAHLMEEEINQYFKDGDSMSLNALAVSSFIHETKSVTLERILEIYINSSYMGAGAFGVAKASERYFGKKLSELTLAEIAYLAILPIAPTRYHPVSATQKAIERRNWLIDQLLAEGTISQKEAETAKMTPLEVSDFFRE